MSKHIVVLGAGYAGVEAALHLNRKGKRDDIKVTIIDKNPYHTLLTELHEVAGHRQAPETVRIPLAEIFRDTRVNVVTDEVTAFDFDGKKLTGRKGAYAYDYLVMAVGSSPAYFGIPGLQEYAFTLWSYDDAAKIRKHVRDCFEKAVEEKDPAERKRLLTFVVGGAAFTGVEMVGELAHWLKPLCEEYGIDRGEVRLTLVDMLKRVLPNMDEKNAAKAHRYMEKKLGIQIMLETAVTEMKPDRAITSKGELETRTLIWCAGVCCSTTLQGSGMDCANRAGRLQVDEFSRTGKPGVYAAGDCSGLGEDGKPYAAMVENAIQTADGAAANILREIRGEKGKPVKVKFHGMMVCVGPFFGVSDIMGKKLPSWLSLVMKYMVNVHYLFEIMGVRGPGKYLKDEVCHRQQSQFFLEKHYTRKMQAWWAMPLRMFLGGFWLYEGIQKISESWLTTPKLAEFMSMTRGYQLADVATSATAGGAATRLDTVVDVNLKVVQFILGNSSKLVEGNPITSEYFGKINLFHFDSFNLVPWLVQNLALSTHGGEMFFQIVITLAEVVIGLLLLGGAFTFPAAVVSLGLLGMFVTSTGLYLSTWWMAFASIVCLGGAGRAFGMDYYLVPWYSRVWENFWKNRSLKLFFPKKK